MTLQSIQGLREVVSVASLERASRAEPNFIYHPDTAHSARYPCNERYRARTRDLRRHMELPSRLLAQLPAVNPCRINQRFFKSSREFHFLSLKSDAPLMLNSIAGKRDATIYLPAPTVNSHHS